MPFGIQPIHIFVIAIAALLIFGPSRLPEIGRSIGRGLTEFRRGAKEMSDNFLQEVNQADVPLPTKAVSDPVTPTITPDPVPAPTQVACPTCGTLNPANARFCNDCGSTLK